jgi:hypothetical protein
MGVDEGVSIAHCTHFYDIAGETSRGADGVDDFRCLILKARIKKILVREIE